MIARALAFGLLVALAGCVSPRATAPPSSASSIWLVGSWLGEAPGGSVYPLACESDAPVNYSADGRYLTYGEAGRWALLGDRLTMTLEEVWEEGADRALIGKPRSVRVERLGPDRIAFSRDGERTVLRRCP